MNQAPATTTRRLASLRAFSKYAGYPSILAEYMAPKPAPTTPHPLPGGIEDVRACLADATQDHHRALLALIGLCGLRIGEALSCNKHWFDVERMELTVRGKGDKTRVVPVSVEAWRHIEPAYNNTSDRIVGICDSSARRFIVRMAGNPSHDFRATFATALNDNPGVNIRTVQELLGHASLVTTQIYTKVHASAKREAVNF